jgi:hypothetical protein
MTFAALSPTLAWLLIAAVAAVAAAVFLIRPRPGHELVSSLILWQRVLDRPTRKSLWERIRWLVSLVLMVAIAVLMAVAFLRPVPRAGSKSASGRVLIVLDSSWSMRAGTPGATRWGRAIREAHAIVDASGGEVALATTAEGIVEGPTADAAVVHRALDRLAPSGGGDGSWPQIAGADAVHFLTDGAVARALDAGVVVHSVFEAAPNVAVTELDALPDASGSAIEVSLAVANFAPARQAVQITVTRASDVIFSRSVEIAAGATVREVVAAPTAGDPRFRVHVRAAQNALDVDDEAAAWLWTAQALRVAVVGVASAIPALLASDPSLRVTTVDPRAYEQATADLWIFDRWLPPAPPSKPALIVDPPSSTWLGPRGADENGPQWRTEVAHPILEGVDASLLRLGHARGITRPALQTIAVSEQHTPLVAIEDSPSGRYVVLGFSIGDSNFAATPAFPVLVGNAVDWLGRPERGARHQPGPIALPAATERVIAPSGESLPLVKIGGRVSASLPAPGLYLVESAGQQTVVQVDLGDPSRSNLMVGTPAPKPSSMPAPRAPGRQWWRYAALAALGLIALEWVTWRRRVTV